MGTTHKTGCVLCAQNCGLIAEVEDNRIVKVRGDKDNVRSEGYLCRKGLNISWHQHNADRLQYPLKRTAKGFERISWEEALGSVNLAALWGMLQILPKEAMKKELLRKVAAGTDMIQIGIK